MEALIHNCEMDIKTIRRDNFQLLLDHECGPKRGRNIEMAAKLDVEPSYISLIKNGRREIGDKTARKMEEAFGKKFGWMDSPQQVLPSSLEIKESQVVYKTTPEKDKNTPQAPVLKGPEAIEYISSGKLPKEFETDKSPLPAPDFLRLFAIDEESYTNSPLLNPGSRYFVLPVDVIQNGLLAAVALNGMVAIGRYERTPFGDAKLATAEEKHSLPIDHKVLGRVIQIIPK